MDYSAKTDGYNDGYSLGATIKLKGKEDGFEVLDLTKVK